MKDIHETLKNIPLEEYEDYNPNLLKEARELINEEYGNDVMFEISTEVINDSL